MRVATLLRLIAALSAATLVVLAPVVAYAVLEFRSAKADEALTDEIQRVLFERTSFQDQYLLYREQRALLQWQATHAQSQAVQSRARLQLQVPELRSIVEQMGRDSVAARELFDRIVANTAKLRPVRADNEIYEELDRRLASQLLLKSDALQSAVLALSGASTRRLEHTYLLLSMSFGLCVVLLASGGFGSSLMLGRYLRRRLQPLSDGVKIVAGGHLDYRIPVKGDDEFADLGAEINGMTGQLQDFTTRLEVDIAERKRLARERAVYHQFFERSINPMCVTDADGRFAQVNPAFLSLTGHDAAQMLGQAFRDFVLLEDRESADAELRRRQDSASTASDIRFRCSDGRVLTLSWLVFVDPAERVGYVTARDVTALRQAEAELGRHRHHLELMVEERTAALSIAKEVAETSSRAKTAFLATMSHELRTPLNAIMGMGHLALGRATDARQRRHLEVINQASRHLLTLINDVLDIARIEADRLSIEHIEFRLGEVLGNLSSLMGSKAAETSLRLDIQIDPGLAQRRLRGDPLRLGQILINLTGNAIKFSPPGGPITVRARVDVETVTGLRLHFEVRDEGIGLSAESQSRLFMAFEQADSSTTRRYGGSGLGLAISKRLAELMGGSIGVKSDLGQGSLFWFTVHLQDQASAAIGAASAPATRPTSTTATLADGLRNLRVLVAEDEPINREVIRCLLESFGMQVSLVENGREAVAAVARDPFDLVLMDMQMPQMDGPDATRHIRLLPGRAALPVIAITANAYAADEARCRAAGMNDFIAKPIDADQLFDTLERWLLRPTDVSVTRSPVT